MLHFLTFLSFGAADIQNSGPPDFLYYSNSHLNRFLSMQWFKERNSILHCIRSGIFNPKNSSPNYMDSLHSAGEFGVQNFGPTYATESVDHLPCWSLQKECGWHLSWQLSWNWTHSVDILFYLFSLFFLVVHKQQRAIALLVKSSSHQGYFNYAGRAVQPGPSKW